MSVRSPIATAEAFTDEAAMSSRNCKGQRGPSICMGSEKFGLFIVDVVSAAVAAVFGDSQLMRFCLFVCLFLLLFVLQLCPNNRLVCIDSQLVFLSHV